MCVRFASLCLVVFGLFVAFFFVLSATINGRSDNHTKPEKKSRPEVGQASLRFSPCVSFFCFPCHSCVDLKIKNAKRNEKKKN